MLNVFPFSHKNINNEIFTRIKNKMPNTYNLINKSMKKTIPAKQ